MVALLHFDPIKHEQCDFGTGMTSAELCQKLAQCNILANGVSPEAVRFVTHMDVDREGCARALEAVRVICTAGEPKAARA